jgi:hypothetical protein
MAQPKLYDPKTLWESILTQMAEGHSLSAILRQEGMPSYSYCKEKLREDHELRRRYDQAIEDRADRLADELIALAWTPPPEGLDGRGMSAWVQHLRVKIDVLKWTASKLKPRTWGDRLDVSVTHEQISIIQVLEEASKRVDSIANPKPKEVIDVDSKIV